NPTTNSGRLNITLKPHGDRKADAAEIIARLQPKLMQVEGIQLFLQPVQDLTIETRTSRTQYQYTLEDADTKELTESAPKVEVQPQDQQDPAALRRIYLKSQTGDQVPLNAFSHFEPGTSPLSINHQGQFPAATISFNVAPGHALGEAVDAIHAAEAEIGLPPGVRPDFAGTAQAFQQSLASEPILILAAVVTVYIVLGVLYESYIHPVTILSTLPSAGVGALLALILCHTDFSIIALIGIILLIGIVN